MDCDYGLAYSAPVFLKKRCGMESDSQSSATTNFNIHLSQSVTSIGSLMEGGEEENLIGGKLPRNPWPEAGWGLQCICVCVSRGVGGEGSILAGHWGLSSQQHLQLSWSGSISLSLLGQRCLPPGDSHFFPRLCPASSTLFPCQMTQSSATCFPYLSFPRAVVLYPCLPSLSVTLLVVWCTVVTSSKALA